MIAGASRVLQVSVADNQITMDVNQTMFGQETKCFYAEPLDLAHSEGVVANGIVFVTAETEYNKQYLDKCLTRGVDHAQKRVSLLVLQLSF